MIEYSCFTKYKLCLICCLFLVANSNLKTVYAQSNFEFDKLQVQNYQTYLTLDFNFSKSYLDMHTKDGISIYLSNYSDILKLLISEDFEAFEKLAPNEGIRLEILENMNQNSPYYLFVRAEIKLQWAIVKLKYATALKFEFNR